MGTVRNKNPRRPDEELNGVYLALTKPQRTYALAVRSRLREETGLDITLCETVRSIWSKAIATLMATEPLAVATPPPPPEESLSSQSTPPPPEIAIPSIPSEVG